MSEKKGSGEHPAVVDFKAKAEEIRTQTIPAAAEANRRAEAALGDQPESTATGAPTTAGAYTIVVQGVGAHHNVRRGDADRILARFIRELRTNGHEVSHSTFKNGSEVSMHDDPEALASDEPPKETPR